MDNNLSHNLKVIRKGFKTFVFHTEEHLIKPIFVLTAASVFEWIDDHPAFYQDQTYNLRDSIGVGVYKDGVLLNWIQHPSPKAVKQGRYAAPNAQYYTYFKGRDLLRKAIAGGKESNLAKYTLVLYATAPYGLLVEDGNGRRGTGWWTQGLVPHVKARFIYEKKRRIKYAVK